MIKSGTVVEHVSHTLPLVFFQFLKQCCYKGTAQTTGKNLNHGAGHGVEAPCIYQLYGPEAYLMRYKEQVDAAGWTTTKVSIKEGPEEMQSQPI